MKYSRKSTQFPACPHGRNISPVITGASLPVTPGVAARETHRPHLRDSMIKMADMMKVLRTTDASDKFRVCSLVYATADRKRGTAGEIRELQRARMLSPKRTGGKTLNFQPLGTKDIIAVHPDLIIYFNQQEVV